MTTKEKYLQALECSLRDTYPWAQDKDKLGSFMKHVRLTITTGQNLVILDRGAPSSVAAWRAIGMKGRPTLKGLRGLRDT